MDLCKYVIVFAAIFYVKYARRQTCRGSLLGVGMIICIIMEWTKYVAFLTFINDLYLGAKISVGLIQSWMILEIALRIREIYKEPSSVSTDRFETFEKWIQCAQYCNLTLAFAIVLIILVDDLFMMEAY